MLPAAYRRSNSNPSPRGAMMRRVPPRESVTTKIDRRLRQTSVRTFPYVDKRGKFMNLEVPDAIPSMLHNKKFQAMGQAYIF